LAVNSVQVYFSHLPFSLQQRCSRSGCLVAGRRCVTMLFASRHCRRVIVKS